MQKKWWQSSVVYQIYPRSFYDSNGDGIGDLQGIIQKLPYLQNLGIDVIWLSPVYKSPMHDNGYDISDYQDIAAEFGTMADMDELITKALDHGIRIVMDLVVNHTSNEHPWFIEASASIDSPYRDFYIWRDPSEDGGLPSDMGSVFGGPGWEYDKASGQYYLHLFAIEQPDLNFENPKVLEAIYEMMNWWLDKGIGGFRMDVIDLIAKEIDKGITGNGPRLHPMLQEMNQKTFGDRDVLTVGETWDATPETAKLYSNPDGSELSMVFQFEHITVDFDEAFGKWRPKKTNITKFKEIMNRWQTELADEGWNSLFWNNHDLPRIVSKRGNEGHLRVKSAKMLGSLMHMMKGTPYIYQGEEIGMTNVRFENINDYDDVEIHGYYKENIERGFTHEEMMEAIWENGRDNARTPVQWSSDTNGGFTEGKPWLGLNPNFTEINVEDALSDKDSVFYHYKDLIRLRKMYDVIVYGDFYMLDIDNPATFNYIRRDSVHELLVINNMTDTTCPLTLPEDIDMDMYIILLSNYDNTLSQTKELRPYESHILIREIK